MSSAKTPLPPPSIALGGNLVAVANAPFLQTDINISGPADIAATAMAEGGQDDAKDGRAARWLSFLRHWLVLGEKLAITPKFG